MEQSRWDLRRFRALPHIGRTCCPLHSPYLRGFTYLQTQARLQCLEPCSSSSSTATTPCAIHSSLLFLLFLFPELLSGNCLSSSTAKPLLQSVGRPSPYNSQSRNTCCGVWSCVPDLHSGEVLLPILYKYILNAPWPVTACERRKLGLNTNSIPTDATEGISTRH